VSNPSIPSKTAYADDLLRGELSPEARRRIENIRAEWAADIRIVVPRPVRDAMLGIRPTRGPDLERSGENLALLDGSQRRVLVGSIYEHLIRQTLALFPLNQPPRKARTDSVAANARCAIERKRRRLAAAAETLRLAAAAEVARGRSRGRPRKTELDAVPAE
jgi:hypothetical protein